MNNMDTHTGNSDRECAEHIIEMCGGYQRAIDVVMTLTRAIWALGFTEKGAEHAHKRSRWIYRVIEERPLWAKLEELSSGPDGHVPLGPDSPVIRHIFERLQDAKLGLCRDREHGVKCFHISTFQPYELARAVLADVRPGYEMKYCIMRNIRRTHNCILSSYLIRHFHQMANAINNELPSDKSVDAISSGTAVRSAHIWPYRGKFLPLLNTALGREARGPEEYELISAFIECCQAVGYLLPHSKNDSVAIRTSAIDVDYLMSNLFGIQTGIRGFDDLFGGGLLLTEALDTPSAEGLRGRTVLIKGRFGTGKSLLSMQLAVEVARKGGIAYLMPLEQSADECLYTLEAMRVLPDNMKISIATDVANAFELLGRQADPRRDTGDSGSLIILQPKLKDSLSDFLTAFTDEAKRLRGYPLRLICVDPINSIAHSGEPTAQLRAEMLEKIKEIEAAGVNIILVAEEQSDPKDELRFEENIADTVIYLYEKTRHDYSQRYLEVKKSRLQREQPGPHPFSIISGVGFSIYPTSAAFSAKIRARSLPLVKAPVKFGLPSLDDKLGETAILNGDVIAFYGPAGALKSSLGLLFLLNAEKHKKDGDSDKAEAHPDQTTAEADEHEDGSKVKPVSLLISTRDNEFTFQHMLEPYRVQQAAGSHGKFRMVNIRTLHGGFITPGHIMQRIEDEFASMRQQGYRIDRLMIDGVAHWEMSCPFVRNDETFGDTLLEYLRRRGVTSLLVCGNPSNHPTSVLQRSVIDGADCVVEFDRIEFRGESRVRARILKTRSMRHRRESFDLTVGQRALEVIPTPSLLRESQGGEAKPIKVSIFLHAETTAQKKIYNERLKQQIKSLLSPDTEVHQQDRIYIGDEMNLRASSTVDELQIYQLDEFQVPDAADADKPNFPLHIFPASQWNEDEWDDLLLRLEGRVRLKDKRFFAVPYYENLSLLAYRLDRPDDVNARAISSWEELALACEAWEQKYPDPTSVFFDFPKVTVENYTCLFWEILLSIKGVPQNQGDCGIRKWLGSPEVIKAGKIYRRLCRRAYNADPNNSVLVIHQRENISSTIDVNPNAVVWRHWYSTLNQMLSQMDVTARKRIKVVALPGEITTAGEWYWGIPAHSAAPEVGLQVIKALTTRAKELDRLQQGIGLPTRRTFYQGLTESQSPEVDISSYFSLDPHVLQRLVKNAFKRSDCGCYSQFFDATARHLQNIIEIPDDSEAKVESQIYQAFESFRTSILFTRSNWSCNRCAPARDTQAGNS